MGHVNAIMTARRQRVNETPPIGRGSSRGAVRAAAGGAPAAWHGVHAAGSRAGGVRAERAPACSVSLSAASGDEESSKT